MMLTAHTDGSTHVEAVALETIAATYGTPCFVYSRAAICAAYDAYRAALANTNALVCYAVKANTNLSILRLFAQLGAGFDIVSGGDLQRVMTAGGEPRKIVFSGVGKTPEEMQAALAADILCFNVESARELEQLNEVAAASGKPAPISLRVNPDVDPQTHHYISTGLKTAKFGVAYDAAFDLYQFAASQPFLRITGIDCHIGSQLLDPEPAAAAADKIIDLVDKLAASGIRLEHIDLGGGKGITYRPDQPAAATADYLAPILSRLQGRHETLILEPGRSLVGNAGLLLTRVLLLKHGVDINFAIVDAAMNDLARPALYDAWHDIVRVSPKRAEQSDTWEIVGPVCESGDFLGHGRELALTEGDLLAVLSAGAYGMAMSSNYNSRPRAAEVMVDGKNAQLIRRRETLDDLLAAETDLP